jgi:hypothetical protein
MKHQKEENKEPKLMLGEEMGRGGLLSQINEPFDT